MKLEISLLLSAASLVAGVHEDYTVMVKDASSLPSTASLASKCREPDSLQVKFQALKTKSAVTYIRRPVSQTQFACIETWAVKLEAGLTVVACTEQAAKSGYHTFFLREGQCFASRIPVSASATCMYAEHQNVVHAAQGLPSSTLDIPESELSDLIVSLSSESSKLKLKVTFDEKNKCPELYTYKLEFDGKTEVVTNGSEILTDVTTCVDLLFTLTPYSGGQQSGDSVVYQVAAADLPAAVANVSSIDSFVTFQQSTLRWSGFIKEDPCNTVQRYEVTLFESERGDDNRTMEFSANETEVVMNCSTSNDYAFLKLSAITVGGVGAPDSYITNSPKYIDTKAWKYFDKDLNTCILRYNGISRNNVGITCERYGAQPVGRVQIRQGLEKKKYMCGYVSLKYYPDSSQWRWEDGTIMTDDDPLWSATDFAPAPYLSSSTLTYFCADTGKITRIRGDSQIGALCFQALS